jgi:S-adenosylmethionine hydrolase
MPRLCRVFLTEAKLCKVRVVKLITLTTDFGMQDWFVGTMKGVIARIAPRARVIDLVHDLPPGNISAGAFALAASCPFFPKNTIHVAVVDPGVGSSRRALAVRTDKFFFVGPDNGILSLVLKGKTIRALHSLENDKYFLQPISHTFHGRDIFSSVAAHLSRGVPIQKLGPEIKGYTKLDIPDVKRSRNGWEGEVIYFDRFGNAVTNLPIDLARAKPEATCLVSSRRRWIFPVKPFYQSVPPKSAVAVCGSTGYLELALNGGSAQEQYKLELGTRVALREVESK